MRSASRVTAFADSVFGEMTRLAKLHKAVNLSQGFPDFEAPAAIKAAAAAAISRDQNQYAPPYGTPGLCEAIARDFTGRHGVPVVADEQVTVCCGSTEAMMAVMLACVDPGDEVIVFEPFYENYGPDCMLSGAIPRYVTMHPPEWRFSPSELEAAFNEKTRAIIVNTPNNPTGKVFDAQELETIASFCRRHDVLAITDEIYEHILYDGRRHIPIASLAGMRERTVTINSLSKSYSVTGWRVGSIIAAPELSNSIRKVHDFLTVGAAAPLQEAGVTAVALPESYYQQLAADYTRRRDLLLQILEGCGFSCFHPYGAYYIMADISAFGFPNDCAFVQHLIRDIGVAAVPGSSFYRNPALGAHQVRFAFCKKFETLEDAGNRLRRLKSR